MLVFFMWEAGEVLGKLLCIDSKVLIFSGAEGRLDSLLGGSNPLVAATGVS